MKISTIFIKEAFKDSNKVKRNRINLLNAIYNYISWYSKNCCYPMKIADASRIKGVCHILYTFFGSPVGKVKLCQVLPL